MNVLLLEDDHDLAEFLAAQLRARGAKLTHAATLEEAEQTIQTQDYCIFIIDRVLPDGEGCSWLEQRRALNDRTPAIVLTALGAIADKVEGLRVADDYLVKPFDMEELWARVQVLLRRTSSESLEITLGDWLKLDRFGRRVTVDGKEIRLKPMEFRLLEYLVLNRGSVVTRTMILEAVWGFQFDPSTNIVQAYMSRLRAEIETPGREPIIETIRGKGYRMRSD